MLKHFLNINDVSDSDLGRLFFTARSNKNLPLSNNCVVMTCFFEPSTRTRMSFEMAALRLGARLINFDVLCSSMKKGETWEESMHTLAALSPDIIIGRTSFNLETNFFAHFPISYINGGDGSNEHPTQALLDAFTLLEHFKTDDLSRRRILIIGDSKHSRVAHSSIKLFRRLGANVTLLAPRELLDIDCPFEHFNSFKEVEGQFDAVMVLRIQKERLDRECKIDDTEYFYHYGLSLERFLNLGKKCVLMHPGPMNIGIDIETGLYEHPRSLIRRQVQNGLSIRTELLRHYLQI